MIADLCVILHKTPREVRELTLSQHHDIIEAWNRFNGKGE